VALVRSFARSLGLGNSNGCVCCVGTGPRNFKRLVCVCGHRASELQTAGVLAHMTREASDVLGDLVHRARGFSSHVYVTGDEGSINT
jgi:hypothetical protein